MKKMLDAGRLEELGPIIYHQPRTSMLIILFIQMCLKPRKTFPSRKQARRFSSSVFLHEGAIQGTEIPKRTLPGNEAC